MLFSGSDLSHFIDSVMLFGAALERRQDKVCVRIWRALSKRASLAWIITQLEMHDIETTLVDTADKARLLYRTKPISFLVKCYERWYKTDDFGGGVIKMPSDLVIDLPAFVMWSVDALASCRNGAGSGLLGGEYKEVKYSMAGASDVTVDGVIRQALALGWHMTMRGEPGNRKLIVSPEDRPGLESYVCLHVPRAVWGSRLEVADAAS